MLLDFWPSLINVQPPAPPAQGSPRGKSQRAYRPILVEWVGVIDPAEAGAGATIQLTVATLAGDALATAAADSSWTAMATEFTHKAGQAIAEAGASAVVAFDDPLLTDEERILLLLLGDL